MNAAIHRKLNFRISVITVLCACLIVGTIELRALNAKDPTAHPAPSMNSVECVRCHSDPKSINTMRLKEDGANYLFKSDGSFKDPKAADWVAHHLHDVSAKQKAW